MIRPDKRIKKLSTAIKRGFAIAQERGIRVARGEMFRIRQDGQIYCACAMGMAAIGLFGVDNAVNYSEKQVAEATDNGSLPVHCNFEERLKIRSQRLYGKVMEMNDDNTFSIPRIVEELRACGQ